MYIYVYIYIDMCVFMCLCIYIYIYIYIYNISFFHRLMSFKVDSCVNLNGTNRKEDRTQREKKSFTDRKSFEAIVCKYIICHLGFI